MVKLLTTKAKIEKTDRYKRTALTHATMNGSASVVSYLLSRGANPNRADTSGLGCYIFNSKILFTFPFNLKLIRIGQLCQDFSFNILSSTEIVQLCYPLHTWIKSKSSRLFA